MGYDITSSSNDRIKRLARLGRRRQRDRERLFVVEGRRLYERALANRLEPEVTFVSETTTPTRGEVVTVEPSVLDRVSYRSRSEGIIALFPYVDTSLRGIDTGDDPILLVVEDLEKPGNFGAMARTARVSGATALIAIGNVDVHNPNALRSSTGAIFELPLAVTSWNELDPWLEGRGISVMLATPDSGNPHWEADLTKPVALVIGSEHAGHSDHAAQASSERISIPQVSGAIDSLNASVAAGVLLYEALRQRRDPEH